MNSAAPPSQRRGPLIALIAGEASGDLLGAKLLDALRALVPQARFVGIGGPRMRAQDMDCWHDITELSVMGLSEVLRHLPRLLRLRRELTRRLLHERPALTIGIDAPDFNLGLERRLKHVGLPIAHYVSPSVWAWRENRAARLGASADRVLCLFPMEPAIYARHGVDARFVGHPLADHFAAHNDRAAARDALGIAADAQLLAVLPGTPPWRGAAPAASISRCRRAAACARPALNILIPAANATLRTQIEATLTNQAPPASAVRVLDGQADLLLRAADAALLASGTATLEA
ncbi:Glycosyl transferase, family 19, partial [mine drainage metagenome]